MTETTVVRNVIVRAKGEGLDALKQKLDSVSASQAGLAKTSETAGAATEQLSRRQLSGAAAWDSAQRSVDKNFRAQQEYERVLRAVDRAAQQGHGNEARRAEVLSLAAERYRQATSATSAFQAQTLKAANANNQFTQQAGLARHELINLSRQFQDVGVSLASGQSPFTVLIQQGTQIADVFAASRASVSSFFAQAARGVAGFAMSGAGLATGGAAIFGVAAYSAMSYAQAQRDVESSLRAVGAASGATLASINKFAEAEARAGKVSTASAREIATAFAATGRVDPSKLPGLGNFTRDYSAFTGTGMTDAAQELAKAFADPSKGAEALAGKIGGLNSATLRWIGSQQAAGDMLGAQKTLLATFQQQVEGATERTGAFARAWDGVKRSLSEADEALGRALNGPTAAEQLAALQKQRERLQASPGLGVNNQLRLLEAQIRPLEAIVELERQRAAIEERTSKAANAGLAASAISDQIDPYRKALEDLTAQRTKLEEARKLNPLAKEYDEWGLALGRVDGAIKTMLPSSERERQSHELALKAINARTLAERTAIEVAREMLRLSGDKVSAAEREAAAVRKTAEAQAQANRDAQDALKASRDQLALAGLRPGERFKVEQAQRYRDNVEKFGGSGSIDRDTLLNAIERFESGGRNVPNYKFGPGFTAQGNFQITNSTWKDIAKSAGIDLGQYPNAMSAPYDVQRRAASALIDQRGVQPWAPHNPALRNWLAGNGGDATARTINDNFAQGREKDLRLSVIGAAEDDLKRQTKALELQQQAFGKSTAEVARQNKEQELFNRLIAAGGEDLAGKFGPRIKEIAAGYGDLAAATERAQIASNVMSESLDIGASAFKGIVSDLRNGKTAAEAFANALNRVADKMLDTLIDGVFGKGILGNAFGNGGGLFGSLSKGIFGFDEGGYTGAGARLQPAGVVHKGEYVFSAQAVNRMGVRNLDAMHRGAMKGYDSGGLVTPAAAYSMPAPYIHQPAPASNSNQPAPVFNVNVTGATGNQEVRGMVAAGIAQGMRLYDQQLDKTILSKVQVIDARMRR